MFFRNNPNNLRDEIIDRQAYEKELQSCQASCLSKSEDYLSICSKLGELYRIDGQNEEAKRILRSVLTDLGSMPNQKLECLTELRLAITFQYEGDFENSLNLFEKLEYEPIEEFESFVYQHRGKLEFEMGNFWMAIHYLERARRLRLNKPELLESTEIAIHRVKKELRLR